MGEDWAGLLFVGFMFLGVGVGLLFGRPDAGGAIGMGLGFIAMGLAKALGRGGAETRASTSAAGAGAQARVAGAAALALVGLGFIAAGLALLVGGSELLARLASSMGPFVLILLGLVSLAAAWRYTVTRGGQRG